MRERQKEVSETGTVDLFRILVLIHRTIIAAELDRCGMVKHKEHTDFLLKQKEANDKLAEILEEMDDGAEEGD